MAGLAAAAIGLAAAACGATTNASPTTTGGGSAPFIGRLHSVSRVASTVPGNGDLNPYGVVVVRSSGGRLQAGDVLVSNFNDRGNVQGTGTTIVLVTPRGSRRLFAHVGALPPGQSCPGGIGLSTALGILPGGWVVVGSLPTTTGGALPSLDPAGCLLVLNDDGTPVEAITNKNIVGPWDLTLTASRRAAELFVANALGGDTKTDHGTPVAGNCTVVRIDLRLRPAAPPVVVSSTVIGDDYPWQANKAALVLAPTGLALGSDGTLYVDDTQINDISVIPHAFTRASAVAASSRILTSGGGLRAPLGMTRAPNGDLLVVNGDDGDGVEVTPTGRQVAARTLVPHGAGDLFGLTLSADGRGVLFVNDGQNVLDLYHT